MTKMRRYDKTGDRGDTLQGGPKESHPMAITPQLPFLAYHRELLIRSGYLLVGYGPK